MPKNFDYWKKQHDSEELKEFNSDRLGTLWLKVKSIVRREYINQFCYCTYTQNVTYWCDF